MMTHFMLDGVLNESSVEKFNWIEQAIPDQFSGFFYTPQPQGEKPGKVI